MSETWGAPSKHEVWQIQSIKPCLKIIKWNGHQGGQEWHYPRASTEHTTIFFSSLINRVGLRPPASLWWSPKPHISVSRRFISKTVFVQKLVFISTRPSEFNFHSKEEFCSKGRWAWLSNQEAQVKRKVDWFLHLCSKGAWVTQPGSPLGRGREGRDGVSSSCRNLLRRTPLVIPGRNWDQGVGPHSGWPLPPLKWLDKTGPALALDCLAASWTLTRTSPPKPRRDCGTCVVNPDKHHPSGSPEIPRLALEPARRQELGRLWKATTRPADWWPSRLSGSTTESMLSPRCVGRSQTLTEAGLPPWPVSERPKALPTGSSASSRPPSAWPNPPQNGAAETLPTQSFLPPCLPSFLHRVQAGIAVWAPHSPHRHCPHLPSRTNVCFSGDPK